MICSVCGSKMDDDSKFCAVCGSRVSQPDSQTSGEAREVVKMNPTKHDSSSDQKEITNGTNADFSTEVVDTAQKSSADESMEKTGAATEAMIESDAGKRTLLKGKLPGLAAGTFFIILGLIRIMTAGSSISSTSFGADFYTYTYQGIVAVTEQLSAIEVTLGWILAAIGAAIDVQTLRS